eukprot:TRINITY_DN1380_c0_g3_i3.p1 TRINITY_DN1380_c0_g3~~TRINITY_DN1380_c0_g3_i3.p1  ORF type:complete len:342 (+),score=-16.29 TRINITY_DN1380_c0_g3_i3:149-1174(+)
MPLESRIINKLKKTLQQRLPQYELKEAVNAQGVCEFVRVLSVETGAQRTSFDEHEAKRFSSDPEGFVSRLKACERPSPSPDAHQLMLIPQTSVQVWLDRSAGRALMYTTLHCEGHALLLCNTTPTNVLACLDEGYNVHEKRMLLGKAFRYMDENVRFTPQGPNVFSGVYGEDRVAPAGVLVLFGLEASRANTECRKLVPASHRKFAVVLNPAAFYVAHGANDQEVRDAVWLGFETAIVANPTAAAEFYLECQLFAWSEGKWRWLGRQTVYADFDSEPWKAQVKALLDQEQASKFEKAVAKCQTCSKRASLKLCSRCQLAWYCSPGCQKTNWPAHKTTCKPV